ncbi:CHAT domain-containing protein [Candidatus Leptofilum sp.]|uniref:CHAT domain-containing protein n=1 Tax=Candidatus Leptofilum sp. TaxID=3241576 RepID=UPI003B598F79
MNEYRHLYSLIEDVFDLDGIRTLCIELKFETGVDISFENLAGDTIRRKSQELQEFARRNGITPELLQVIHSLKPRIDLTKFGGPEPDLSKPDRPTNTGASSGEADSADAKPEIPQTVYDNFDITIRPSGTPNAYRLEAESPNGEASAGLPQVFPFEDDDYQYLAKSLRDVQISEPKFANDMGEILRKFLFPGPIQELFTTTLNVSRAKGKDGIRVRININQESSELYQVPWEYCRDDKSFLSLNADTPLVRYMPTNRAPAPISVPYPVKILLAWANPEDLDKLDVQSEIDAVKGALAQFVDEGKVVIDELPNVSPTTLVSKVRQNPPHIFHFIGHGALLPRGGGALALDNGRKSHVMLDGDRMLRLFQGDDTKLIILSACQSGATSDKAEKSSSAQAFMGLAPKLVWGGLPAVVAMQYDLPNIAAQPFMQTLYEFLALGKPLDTAVTEARIGLDFNILESPYWGIPVLFMRSPDGNIWV